MNKTPRKLEWDDAMSVGIPEIDEDHKKFIVLINMLNFSIIERLEPAEIRKRLQLIVDDAKQHFMKEESLFKEWQYPDAEGHARTHSQVLTSIERIQDSFIPYGLDAEWLDAALIIKNILISHILTEDKQYMHFLKSRQ